MEADADDLDDLIKDSLGGLKDVAAKEQSKADVGEAGEGATGDAPEDSDSAATKAVSELKAGPRLNDGGASEELFARLVQTFQDPEFQGSLAKILEGPAEEEAGAAVGTSEAPGTSQKGPEDFLTNFMKSFEAAVGSDDEFSKSLTSLMTSMLSSDLVCEPLQQIVEPLEAWLAEQGEGDLSAAERARYEAQLRLYRQIIGVYKAHSDPLPQSATTEVQGLFQELHALGQPPEEVLRKASPPEAEGDGANESFEDFMKSMGLTDGLGGEEMELLKKLGDDPEELQKAMKEMTAELAKGDGNVDEACKQQ